MNFYATKSCVCRIILPVRSKTRMLRCKACVILASNLKRWFLERSSSEHVKLALEACFSGTLLLAMYARSALSWWIAKFNSKLSWKCHGQAKSQSFKIHRIICTAKRDCFRRKARRHPNTSECSEWTLPASSTVPVPWMDEPMQRQSARVTVSGDSIYCISDTCVAILVIIIS